MKLENAETTYRFTDHASGSTDSVEIVVENGRVIQVLVSGGLTLSMLKAAVNQLSLQLAPENQP